MRIAIAGAHGQIGLRLVRILAGRGEEVVGLIRNPDHASDVAAAGGQPVVCDLEQASTGEVAAAVGADSPPSGDGVFEVYLRAAGRILYLNGGNLPIAEALENVLA